MSKVSEMTREKWIMNTFPEWGTWLVEEIEAEEVPEGNTALWWLGCTGLWIKTQKANISVDLWCGNGKRTHGDGKMKPGHQMANMCGGRKMQPNLRAIPFVIDPFAFHQVDAVLATHYHQDHMSAEWAAHVLQSGMTTTDENGNELTMEVYWPTEEYCAEMKALLQTLDTPAYTDEVILDYICKDCLPAVTGQAAVDDCVNQVLQECIAGNSSGRGLRTTESGPQASRDDNHLAGPGIRKSVGGRTLDTEVYGTGRS